MGEQMVGVLWLLYVEKEQDVQNGSLEIFIMVVIAKLRRNWGSIELWSGIELLVNLKQHMNNLPHRYWYLKSLLPGMNSGGVGGTRRGKSCFEFWEKKIVKQYIIEYFRAYPKSRLKQLAIELAAVFERNVTIRVFDQIPSNL
jgi:hypothetical protein